MRRAAGVATLFVLASPAGAGEGRWRVEAALGAARSFGSTLEVEQAGFPTLRLEADCTPPGERSSSRSGRAS